MNKRVWVFAVNLILLTIGFEQVIVKFSPEKQIEQLNIYLFD
jgi:hypothetical protein